MKRAARRNLAVSATNALLEHGMPRLLEDLDPSERGTGDFHTPRMRVNFSIDGVPCCAASMPSGHGEESIAVVYDTNNVDPAIMEYVLVDFVLPPRTGYTATKFCLDRRLGLCLQGMNVSPNTHSFRTRSGEVLRTLRDLDVTPDGFHAAWPHYG